MLTRSIVPPIYAALLLGALAAAPAVSGSPQSSPLDHLDKLSVNADAAAPSEAEISLRAKNLIENQHKNDQELEQYERIERHLDRTGGPNPRTVEDRVYRVVPTGTGTLKILLRDNGTPTNPEDYRHQLQAWEDVLELMLKPADSRSKTAYEKYDRRQKERAELVDAMSESFVAKWAGQETLNGRECDVFDLSPNPNFHPHSIFQEALTRVGVKVWIDHKANQLVRGEAHVTRDISFGGGILGKLYRGGVFVMEQAELAPGVWLPTRYQYDFEGRKFLFTFEEHQVIEASHYRHIGPPKEALTVVQNELATGKTINADP